MFQALLDRPAHFTWWYFIRNLTDTNVFYTTAVETDEDEAAFPWFRQPLFELVKTDDFVLDMEVWQASINAMPTFVGEQKFQ